MGDQYSTITDNKIAFRTLLFTDINDLTTAGFPYKGVLNQVLGKKIYKMAGLIPRSTGIVAIIVEQKYAIGFLSLVQHTKSLFSIKFVFVNPKYRKMGIAARLIDYAICQAKQRGAKKIYLNADINNNSLVNYYRKLGFDLIIDNSMLWGNGFSAKLPIAPNNHLTYLNIRSKTNIDRLLKTYTRYMGKQWVDFFDINKRNIVNGFSQDHRQHIFQKSVFINDSANLIIFFFKIPLSSSGVVEVYTDSNSIHPSLLENVSKLLHDKKVKYAKIMVFNIRGNEYFDLLKKMGFYPFQARLLGKCL